MSSVQQTSGNQSPHAREMDAAKQLISAKVFATFLTTVSIGLLLMFLTLIVPFFTEHPTTLPTQLTQQIGIALFVAGLVSLFTGILVDNTRDRLEGQISKFLQTTVTEKLTNIQEQTEEQTKRLQDNVTKELTTIQDGIKAQTEQFVDTSASLQAMSKMDITHMYLERKNAIGDIRQDLGNLSISKIRLIGISLNDFVRDSGVFHEVWKVIEGYIRGDSTTYALNQILDIQVLIIDPACQGAHLRSLGEYRDSPNEAGKSRLAMDVAFTQASLADLTKAVEKNPKVTFSFRFYQSPPLLFLLHTDTASYVQSYHFWRSRDPDTSMPLLRYSCKASIHDSMDAHFNWIWEKAAVSYSDYVEQHKHGTDKGLHQSGLINVFDDPKDAKDRILALLKGKTEYLYLQGFSLRSYADEADKLYWQIEDLVKEGIVDIRILLINPDSEQAIYRAFREYRLEDPLKHKKSFDDFSKGMYKSSQLYRDTERTIRQFRKIDNSKNTFHFKWYKTAPYCFMLMVDESVLVEQYHYGKIGPSVGTKILGRDMARFEYVKEPSDLYEVEKPLQTYYLMKEHFKFVYEECAEDVPDDFGVTNSEDTLSSNRTL